MILKSIANVMSPQGAQARLSILIFHRVLPKADPLFPEEPDGRRFDEILAWVARWFQVIPLDDAVARLRANTLPARAAAITFDDGYADNALIALPILRSHGMAATFFVATSFLDGGRMWNDTVIESVRAYGGKVLDLRDEGLGAFPTESQAQRRAAIDILLAKIKYLESAKRDQAVAFIARSVGCPLPGDLMMMTKQVLQLRQEGMQIGAHTCTHPILTGLSDDDAFGELLGSKIALEQVLDQPILLFAYPNGKPGKDYLAKHANMARRAGFVAAVSTAAGVANASSDCFQLPRFTPWDRSKTRYGMRLMRNLRMTTPELA